MMQSRCERCAERVPTILYRARFGSRVDKMDPEGKLLWSRRNAAEKVGATEGVIICGAGPLPAPVVTKLVKQALQVRSPRPETDETDEAS